MRIILLALATIVAGLQPAVAAPGLPKIEPAVACKYLQEIGFGVNNWTSRDKDVYGCSSPSKELSSQHPTANNLIYYVEGKADRVSRLKLVLNASWDPQEEGARGELMRAAILLTAQSLNRVLPITIQNAIIAIRSASAEEAGVSFEVLRLDWPTGKGYELQFIIE